MFLVLHSAGLFWSAHPPFSSCIVFLCLSWVDCRLPQYSGLPFYVRCFLYIFHLPLVLRYYAISFLSEVSVLAQELCVLRLQREANAVTLAPDGRRAAVGLQVPQKRPAEQHCDI